MVSQSPPTPQTHKPIIYQLDLHTRDRSLQPGIDDQRLPYLRMNLRTIVSPRPARSSFNPPVRRKRNHVNLRRAPVNKLSYKSKRNPLKSTSTHRSLLLHPQMILFYFAGLPGAAERDRYRNNREEHPLYANPNVMRRPHLRPMNLQRSPLPAHGVKST